MRFRAGRGLEFLTAQHPLGIQHRHDLAIVERRQPGNEIQTNRHAERWRRTQAAPRHLEHVSDRIHDEPERDRLSA
jgi:hypothetical protein